MNREKENSYYQKKSFKTSNFDVEALMTCFALAEHRLYGFGKKRIKRSWSCIEALMDDILNDNATLDDYKKELDDIL